MKASEGQLLNSLRCAFFTLAGILLWTTALHAEGSVLWDMADLGRFDPTNKAYENSEGHVTVDLRNPKSLCPTGLGELAGGRPNVREITVKYEAPAAKSYWFHVGWNPSAVGKKQFEVCCNGNLAGRTDLIDAEATPYRLVENQFEVPCQQGLNELAIRYLTPGGMRFESLTMSETQTCPRTVSPALEFATLEHYTKALGEPGVMLDSENVRLFAPKRLENDAKEIFKRLVRGYDELHKIAGVDTPHKIVIQSLSPNHPYTFGGTTTDYNVIKYSYTSLELAGQVEWVKYGVPHVSGYLEEMAHNFTHAAHSHFGSEAVGWSLGVKVTNLVAPNPHQAQLVATFRREDAEFLKKYIANGYRFPLTLTHQNLQQEDRIHHHLLWECEQQYGPTFWRDYFAELQKEETRLEETNKLTDSIARANVQYQICVECFDHLAGLNFKKRLTDYHISATMDVFAISHKPSWNGKYE
jgi:hypothetical protein